MFRIVRKTTNERKVEWLKMKTRDYFKSSSLVSVFHSDHATRGRFGLDICALCTWFSDTEFDFKAGKVLEEPSSFRHLCWE